MGPSPIHATRATAILGGQRKLDASGAENSRAAPESPPNPGQQRVSRGPTPAPTDVQTHFDAMTKTLVASVVDKETGSVVAEVPPEALRILAQRTAEFRGKIFDTKI